jgi:phospholipid N-methyltransferase
MKSMLKSKLKSAGVPEADMNRLLGAIERNPDFFKTLAEKVQQKMSVGMNQEEAVMAVLGEEQGGLQNVLK